ncbi:MAG: 5-oxoprolinase subunit PxpA [Bacteroidota bacterium]
MNKTIDLNADLGEHHSLDIDRQIMPYISSCNIAAGGHTGNEVTIRAAVRLAKQYKVAVGAHPSFPDKKNFGREEMTLSPDELAGTLRAQILKVKKVCTAEQVDLHHVKLHGALYNKAAADRRTCKIVVQVLQEISPKSYWLLLANSVAESVAKNADYPYIREGFADRRYTPGLQLVDRSEKGAVLEEQNVLAQVKDLALNHQVSTAEGAYVPLHIQSICLHGDTKGAIMMAKKINAFLIENGVTIAAIQ